MPGSALVSSLAWRLPFLALTYLSPLLFYKIIAFTIDKFHKIIYNKPIIFYSKFGVKMNFELIYQSHHENLEKFVRTPIKARWDAFILVEDGEYYVKPQGDTKPFVIRKNEIALIPANMEFSREVLSPVTYHYILFSPLSQHPFYLSATRGKLPLPQSQTEAILESARYASMVPDNRDLLLNLVEHIFAQNYLFGNKYNESSKPFSEEIERAVRYMQKNLTKKIDMDALAEHVFLSHSGLIWKFKQELNTTPTEYLHLLRMRNAKRLLLGSSYNISQISEMCGFSNPYYFTNVFRKYAGMSPSAFRSCYLK